MSIPNECPKCGRFTKYTDCETSWARGPRFISGLHAPFHTTSGAEWLEYVCKDCGYTFYEPTKDSKGAIPKDRG